MSGTRGAYEPLRQTQREVENGREAGSPRNYEALRQTQHEVDARPMPSPQQVQDTRNPFENREERIAANSQMLDEKVKAGRISQGEKIHAENVFDNKIEMEMKAYTEKQKAEALDRLAAIQARSGPDRQSEQQKEMER